MRRTMGSPLRPAAIRRGVTLVEMLVTVAVLVIIMTVMVQIFQSATGALTAAQTIQDLDNQLKLLDATIRTDLDGVTARFTPPLDPVLNAGYFEYIENEFADMQGEDSDDCLRFTAKAPAGQPFTGRMWLGTLGALAGMQNPNAMPITVTSEYAEIIYFLRNGNLYRRVLLVAPELQSAIFNSAGNQFISANASVFPFRPPALGGNPNPGFLSGPAVSWQGVNDLSAHPAKTGPAGLTATGTATATAFADQTVQLNTLSSLTNRENRYAAPRFSDDLVNTLTAAFGADGFSDDLNADKVPDLYPTLYPNVISTGLITAPNNYLNLAQPTMGIYQPNTGAFTLPNVVGNPVVLGFPYIFPGAYSSPQVLSKDQFGWIHSPTPLVFDQAGNTYQFDGAAPAPLTYLQNINHNPLDVGDNSSIPDKPTTPTGFFSPLQTWWGFPTWRETLSVNWTDPTQQVNDNVNFTAFGQPNGLTPRPASVAPVNSDTQLLPWMSTPGTISQGGPLKNGFDYSIIRRTPQLFSDTASYKANMSVFLGAGGAVDPAWLVSWEDDLIMTNVRSFDVKAYDNAFAGYADLGWADDLRLWLPYQNLANFLNPKGFPPALASTPATTIWPPLPVFLPNGALGGGTGYDTLNQTFAHEGRMPPIINDLRFDPQFSLNPLPANSLFLVANGGTYNGGNVGDDSPGVIRLRRVWDSWSTDYSRVAPNGALNTATGQQQGLNTGFPPIYPSYPPPYPAPLRGIQIQIRVADPTNQRIKSLTIRQDFTDKL